jgi:hypothetical protein
MMLMGLSVTSAAWLARPARIVTLPQPRLALSAWTATPSDAAPAPTASAAARPVLRPSTALAPAPEPLAAAVEPAAPITATPDLSPPSLHWTSDRAGRIASLPRRSRIDPGFAVRVVATMAGPEGPPYWQDITAFGSQAIYRKGAFGWDRDRLLTTETQRGPRHGLFTAVEQQGERLLVTASLDRSFDPATSGTIALKSGETGYLTLPGGQQVTLTPTLRPETPDEIAEAQRTLDRMAPRGRPADGGVR